MKRFSLILFIAWLGCCAFGQKLPDWAAGLSGVELLEAVRNNSRPTSHVDLLELQKTLASIDCDDYGTIINRFSANKYPLESYTKLGQLKVVPDEWTSMAGPSLKEFLTLDLFNMFPCETDIVNILNNGYGPGVPEKITFDNGIITIGESGVYSIGRWQFPAAFEGELARAFLYMVAVYPMTQWSALASNYLDSFSPLVIKKETLDYILKCHNDNTPGDREKARNEAVGSLQGNSNPFISYPELANTIWAGNTQNDDDNPGEEPGEEEDPGTGDQPEEMPGSLKAAYTAGDEWIWLASKYIPADAEWQIDGNATDEKKISVSSLAKGKHLLEYNHPAERGKITIEIR